MRVQEGILGSPWEGKIEDIWWVDWEYVVMGK